MVVIPTITEGPTQVLRDKVWKNPGGMWDPRNIEGEIRDENSLAGSGCAYFNSDPKIRGRDDLGRLTGSKF